MKSLKLKAKLILIAGGLISILLLGASCTPSGNLGNKVASIVEPHSFNLSGWEFKTIFGDLTAPDKAGNVSSQSQTVIEYFSLAQRISVLESQMGASDNVQQTSTALKTELDKLEAQKMDLEGDVEHIVSKQITEVLVEQGIYNPFDKYIELKINFPGIYFKLEEPPNLLVISPRDRIEKMGSVLLNQDTPLQEDENIESRVDKLGVSSLVVPLGGVATYPSFVADGYGLKSTIDTITHEWVHQYLTFKPLGFLYLLDTIGVSRNYEDATIDETVADMVGEEISTIVDKKYYPNLANGDGQLSHSESDFFNQRMKEIRKAVNEYLAQGQIDKAEQYMEAQRQYLASKGYYIRKLNQAYFAFYGTYADSPTSISPIGTELKELRTKSASLEDFLDAVSMITNSKALRAALSKNL